MITHSLTRKWDRGSQSISQQQSISADGEINQDISVPDSSTDLQVLANLDVSAIKALFILSDQDVTLETNSSSAATDTLALKAGIPLIWDGDSGYFTNPFSADVTAFYFTNASGSAATVQIRVLQDVTP